MWSILLISGALFGALLYALFAHLRKRDRLVNAAWQEVADRHAGVFKPKEGPWYNRTKTHNGKHISTVSAFVTNEAMLPHMTFNGKQYWLFPKSVGDTIEPSNKSSVFIPMRDGKSHMFNINNGVNQAFDPNSPNYAKDLMEKNEGMGTLEITSIVLGALLVLAVLIVYMYPNKTKRRRS